MPDHLTAVAAPGRSADAGSGSADRLATAGVRVASPWLEGLPLFTAPVARRGDPPTSHAAATRVDAAGQRYRVLVLLGRAGCAGATNDELDETCHWRAVTASRRVTELWRAGFVERTTTYRATRTGAAALVHCITPAGVAAVAAR